MTFPRLHFLAAVLLVFAAAGAATAAPTAAPTAAEGATKHPKRVKVTFDKSGSGESAKERDRRLTRECRGRPNAGACSGFGQ